MTRKPSFDFERRERDKAKLAKRAEKSKAKSVKRAAESDALSGSTDKADDDSAKGAGDLRDL